MSKIQKPKLKLCRREKMDLFFLSGVKDIKKKCNLNKLPGGLNIKGKLSDFNLQLREKQKIKRIYGLMEKQFKKYFFISKKKKDRFLSLFNILELRLDNVLFRSGLVLTRAHARQLINHKMIFVNDKKINFPSYEVKLNDNICIIEKLKNNCLIKEAIYLFNQKKITSWIHTDLDNLSINIISLPQLGIDSDLFNKDLIVELYSR